MRSLIASAVLGLAALGGTLALPAKADASWLSEALHGNFDPAYSGYYAPGYGYSDYYGVPPYEYGVYTPGYSYYYSPGYVVPYVAPYRYPWYGGRYYGGHHGYRRWHGGWHGGYRGGYHGGHGHHHR